MNQVKKLFSKEIVSCPLNLNTPNTKYSYQVPVYTKTG